MHLPDCLWIIRGVKNSFREENVKKSAMMELTDIQKARKLFKQNFIKKKIISCRIFQFMVKIQILLLMFGKKFLKKKK